MRLYGVEQEPAPPSKAKEKYDEIEMAMVKPYPKEFTKVSVGVRNRLEGRARDRFEGSLALG